MTYDEGQRGLEPLLSQFLKRIRFYIGSSTNLESICSFTKLIDKKTRTTSMYHEIEFSIH